MPHVLLPRFLLAVALAATAVAARTEGRVTEPPVAPVHAVADTYWGQKVADPYQWMEDEKSPEFQSWIKGQNDYTRTVLARIPGRDALRDRIAALSNAGTVVYQVQTAGSSYFYLKLAPGDESPKLYVRDGLAGAERLLVDPEKMGQAGVHYSIDYFAPSANGKLLAYGTSPGGSEDATLGVIEVASGKPLAERIARARFGVTAWSPTNNSFFYSRLAAPVPGAAPGDKYKRAMIFRHVVGIHPDGEGDAPELGIGLSPLVPVAPDELPLIVRSSASPYVLAIVQKFVKNEFTVYAAPYSKLDGAKTPWRKIADESAEVTDVAAHGRDVYLLTHKGAPTFKVLRTSLVKPELAQAVVVVPASAAVLKSLGAAKDALYVRSLDGGLGGVLRMPFGKDTASPVALPYQGAIAEFVVDADRPGLLMKLTSWTEPQLWYHYDPVTGKSTDTGLRPRSPVDYSAITSEEVKARSADGTMVPLSIVHRRDIRLDGSNPTLLSGYGSYGITLDPGFSPTLLAWLERGGVVAVAHVRGGGEYGEDWHRAGQKLNKPNTIADFIACAEYLIEHKYSSSARIAGQGGSAGGITVGGALTQRPKLFAAIIDNVGVSDNLRIELSPNGPPNIPEFGSVKTEDGFKGLYAMSAYHHVEDGQPYPAVLLTTGIHDPRVDSWQMAKMAARLQAATASGKPILLRVDYDAGHGIGSTKSQTTEETADEWAFLLWQFGIPGFQPR
ncbi:MAG: prolyl oligopeptidase family serine peptidase [Caldimonas sp.]